MTPDRSAVAAAVGALDLAELAGRRWYAGKGERPTSASLAHAFPLSDDSVFALIDVRGGDGPEQVDRYALPFVRDEAGAGSWREAAEGDGAWRALGAAIAEGMAIPALTKDVPAPAGPSGTAGAVSAALVCRPSP